jgi:DNA-binding winged helix-turn-helix (wHTH) protein
LVIFRRRTRRIRGLRQCPSRVPRTWRRAGYPPTKNVPRDGYILIINVIHFQEKNEESRRKITNVAINISNR